MKAPARLLAVAALTAVLASLPVLASAQPAPEWRQLDAQQRHLLAPFREHAARVGGCRPPRPRQHLGGGWQAEATLGHCNDGVAERPVV